jgi:renalase
MNVLVIGAGISGCSCANLLAKAGHQVTLVEKGRGVGGRMATRRMDGARIDHGAQFYTARDIRLQSLNKQWCKEKRAIEWYDQVPGRTDIPTDMRFRGITGMTGPAKSLAQRSRLALNFFVEKIEKTKGWKILEREGERRALEADHLVITMPSRQMLELFGRSRLNLGGETMNRLETIRHTSCLAILGILDRPSRLIHPGAVTHPAKNIDWLSDNQVKGISKRPAITLHTSADFSQTNWGVTAEEWAPELLASVEDQLGARVLSWVCHRWGFAKPLATFGASHLHLPEFGLTLAGDGFGGERVEGASISGLEAAEAILGTSF